MNQAAVLGTGLIGASVGLGLASQGWTVVGWDPHPTAATVALEKGAVDSLANDAAAAVAGSDLVVLAGPPASIVALLPSLATSALVTDVAGVKTPIMEAASHLPRFIGGHPMAGREVTGPAAAPASLFHGAAEMLVAVRAPAAGVSSLADLVEDLGARPVRMTATEHDDAVATISHLPQVLAAALVWEAADHPAALSLASGSFRDLTRVAASEPGLWADLLTANRTEAADAVREFMGRLQRWATALDTADTDALRSGLDGARTVRADLAPPTMSVEVALAARPGELASVGRALGSSKADVLDLQLRHATHGGGGILTLSVRPGEAATLRAALAAEGLLVVEAQAPSP